ncbi:hypothetical protein GCM10010329_00660 [Streptomyces spiroverticillatus]|uniref:DUF2079 domain-containing protein n=2 Tax=Streptomyces finlayi TaxID=67296 RepID=A0A919C6P0_9ACTN|nr:hypothetical protein GCM10010329_00660 [Streptomyces spiroverticillatus]GHC76755.1 hypothetical protein GCM10010334_00660 [Streptomyces finlayi]
MQVEAVVESVVGSAEPRAGRISPGWAVPDGGGGSGRGARLLTVLRERLPGPRVLAWSLSGIFFVLYATVAVLRHRQGLNGGFDIGIFEQAVQAYAHGRAPVVELKGPGFNLLGDHFHPILVLLAPFYRVFPSPYTLLVAQAGLLALACFPLTRWAHRAVGPVAALVVGCGVGASWGIVSAAAKDFHEIAFAVPMLAFGAVALGQRRWWAAVLWTAPLLLVKEDLGLTLAAVGAYIVWQAVRNKASGAPLGLGIAVVVLGVVGSAVEILVLLPAMNPSGAFAYWAQMPGEEGSGGGILSLALGLVWPPMKWLLVFMLAAPVAFVGVRSPLLLLCVPTLGWRFVAGNEHYWTPGFHYSAILMPVLFAGFVDVLARRKDLVPGVWRRRALGFAAAFAVVSAAVYPLHDLVLPSAWRTPAHVAVARQVLDRIPDGDTVASSNRLAPFLTSRTTVSLVCYGTGPDPKALPTGLPAHPPRWVVFDRTDPTVKVPCPVERSQHMLKLYREHGYVQVVEEDGVVLLRRP